jgi:hypothetical protein
VNRKSDGRSVEGVSYDGTTGGVSLRLATIDS